MCCCTAVACWMPLHKAEGCTSISTMAWLTVTTLSGTPSFNQRIKRPKFKQKTKTKNQNKNKNKQKKNYKKKTQKNPKEQKNNSRFFSFLQLKNPSTLFYTSPSIAFSNLIALACVDLATNVLQRFAVALECVKQHRLVSSSSRFLWQCNALDKNTVRQIRVGRVNTTSSTTLQ